MYIHQCFIGLLNANQGAFKGYVQKFINNAFTIILQLLLVKFSIILLNGGHFVLCFVASNIALKTPQMLQEFMITSGSSNASSKINTVTRNDKLDGKSKGFLMPANVKGTIKDDNDFKDLLGTWLNNKYQQFEWLD